MLWINLLQDALASISFATERPSDELLARPPYGCSQSLVTKAMILHITSHSIYELTVLFFLLFLGQ